VAWKDETRNCYRVWVKISEGKRMVITHMHNIILKRWECRSCCDNCNEPSGSMKYREFLESGGRFFF
jgi:hypothetical protein